MWICILGMHKSKTHLCQDQKPLHFAYTMRSVILHKPSCMYTHFFKISCFYRRSSESTSGCGKMWHVFRGQVSVFVFDIAQVPNTCIRICIGCISPHLQNPRLHTCLCLLETKYLLSIIKYGIYGRNYLFI